MLVQVLIGAIVLGIIIFVVYTQQKHQDELHKLSKPVYNPIQYNPPIEYTQPIQPQIVPYQPVQPYVAPYQPVNSIPAEILALDQIQPVNIQVQPQLPVYTPLVPNTNQVIPTIQQPQQPTQSVTQPPTIIQYPQQPTQSVTQAPASIYQPSQSIAQVLANIQQSYQQSQNVNQVQQTITPQQTQVINIPKQPLQPSIPKPTPTAVQQVVQEPTQPKMEWQMTHYMSNQRTKRGPLQKDFACNNGTYVTQIEYKDGLYVDAIGFTCSDGLKGPLMGGSGGSSKSITSQSGFLGFDTYSGDWMNALDVYDRQGKVTKMGQIGNSEVSKNQCNRSPNAPESLLAGALVTYGQDGYLRTIDPFCTTQVPVPQ